MSDIHDHDSRPADETPDQSWQNAETPRFGTQADVPRPSDIRSAIAGHTEAVAASNQPWQSNDMPRFGARMAEPMQASHTSAVSDFPAPLAESNTAPESDPVVDVVDPAAEPFFGEPAAVEESFTLADLRLEALDRAIARDPTAAINLLLRGELYLALDQIDAAAADFTRALALAEAEAESLRWGYANSAVIDRATDGLREVAHHPVAPASVVPLMVEPSAVFEPDRP